MLQGANAKNRREQKRPAAPIDLGDARQGGKAKTAKARAWATVIKASGGGTKGGSGRK